MELRKNSRGSYEGGLRAECPRATRVRSDLDPRNVSLGARSCEIGVYVVAGPGSRAACRMPWFVVLALLSLVGLRPSWGAEDWYRMAVLSPSEATTFQQAAPQGVLRVGPVYVDLSADVSVAYNDNVLLSPVPESGTSIVSAVAFDATWEAAKGQQLKFTGELTENQVLRGPGKTGFYLLFKPGSALRYALYVKEIRIMPFITGMRQVDPYASPTVNNSELFKQTSVDGGVQVDVPLNRYVLQLSTSRGFYTAETSLLPTSTTDRDSSSVRLVRVLGPEAQVGIDAFYVNESVRNGPSDHVVTESSSAFVILPLDRAVTLGASLGFTTSAYGQSVVQGDSGRDRGLVATASLSHRVRSHLSYSLTASESRSDGLTSNFYTLKTVELAPQVELGDNLVLRLQGKLQRVQESSTTGETGILRTAGASLDYGLKGNVVTGLTFQDTDKSSTLKSRVYAQRMVKVSVRKQF